jgi:hypothetical protein
VTALTAEQEEAVVRKWACKQLKDSRLLQLPRELACLVTMYAADAAVDNYKNSERMCGIIRYLNTLGSWDNQCICGKPLIGVNTEYDNDAYCDCDYVDDVACRIKMCPVDSSTPRLCNVASMCGGCGRTACPKHVTMDWFSPTANCPRCNVLFCAECIRPDTFTRKCVKCNAIGCVCCTDRLCTHDKPI